MRGGTTNLTLEDLKNDLISDLNLRTDEKSLNLPTEIYSQN